MKPGRSAALRLAACFALVTAATTPARAQDHPTQTTSSSDQEARDIFEAGTTAFNAARYADALADFQRSYELSHRPQLLYNIGVAADRLRKDETALHAFQQFLAQVSNSPERPDAQARVNAIQASIAAHAAHASAPARAAPAPARAAPARAAPTARTVSSTPAPSNEGRSAAWIAGPVTLGVAGVAGVVAAVIGMAGGGGCVDHDATRACVEQRGTSWGAVGLYGGVGLAALAGAVVWLVVGLASHGAHPSATARAGAPALEWSF